MTEAQSNVRGALADRYRIERELGRGGMATVYVAEDLRHRRQVAIKVIHADLAATIGHERFLKEIELTASLQHPHILPLFDSGEADGQLFYVMPFVDGETLRARLDRETQLPVADALRIAVEVADALGYAHERGVIHRDIKPENILLQRGHALVADFGIALAIQQAGGQRMTGTGLSVGTPQYMAPEQAMGERAIDSRADVYAVGAVLYEMLMGTPPFTGPTAQAIVARLLTAPPAPMTAERSSVPAHVERATLTALAKLPADRFATTRDFARALERVDDRSSLPAAARAETPRGTTAREGTAWALFGIATLGLVWALTRHATPSSDAPVIRTEFAVPPGTNLPAPNTSTIALSPNGDRIAFFVQDSNGTRLVVRRSSELRGHEISANGVTNQNVTFSPDGAWVAYSDGFEVKKAPADGGPSVPVGSAPNVRMRGLSWTTADTILIGSPTGIWAVPASGGVVKRIIASDSTGRHYWPVASPDGKLVAFITGQNPDLLRLAVASLKDRTSVVLDVPAVSPLGFVGTHLLYVTSAGALHAVQFDAARLRTTGNPIQIQDSVRVGDTYLGSAATLSVSGTLAYVSGASTNDLVIAAPARADVLVLPDAGSYKVPRFSPDGKRIALTIGNSPSSNIWIYDTALRTLTQLTTEGASGVPEWTADGTRVLFRHGSNGTTGIWWKPATGTGSAELLYQPDDQVNECVLSPDGQWLIYRTGPESRHPSDIFAVSLAGDRKPVALVSGPAADVEPRLSPDGKWLAYASDKSGRNEIYVQPFPGPGLPVQVSNQGGREPIWGKAGRALYYRKDGGGVVAVAVTTGATFSIGERRTVLTGDYSIDQTHAAYDVSPDEKGFLMLRRAAGQSRPTIVYNWMKELNDKLARR